MNKLQKRCSVLLFGAGLALAAMATNLSAVELVVITHADSPLTSVEPHQLKNLYLDKTRIIGGEVMLPVDQTVGRAVRESFYSKIIGENETYIEQYWAKVKFSGKGTQPKSYEDDQAVIERVKKDKRLIGYVEKTSLTDGVKVLLSVP